jgi:hypothetical protein
VSIAWIRGSCWDDLDIPGSLKLHFGIERQAESNSRDTRNELAGVSESTSRVERLFVARDDDTTNLPFTLRPTRLQISVTKEQIQP